MENNYFFIPNLDSMENDIKYLGRVSIKELMKQCESNENCVAFNTIGYIKTLVNDTLVYSNCFYKDSDGIYIHKERYEKMGKNLIDLLDNNNLSYKNIKKLNPVNSYDLFFKKLYKIKQTINYEADDLIPNFIHFIYIHGGHPFVLSHYLAIKTAFVIQKPSKIFLYNDIEPLNNVWWDRAKQIATIINITIPKMLNDHEIIYKQHQADIMRINILNMIGGIYLDIDILSLKNLRNLRKHNIVMGREDGKGLCNCVIMTKPNTNFFKKWIKAYETSYGQVEDYWVGLSVRKPAELAKKYENEIHIEPQDSFTPFLYLDDTIYFSFDCQELYEDSYTIHLWDTEAFKRNVIPKDIDYFKNNDNTFTKLFINYIKEYIK